MIAQRIFCICLKFESRLVCLGAIRAAQWAIFGVKLMCQDKVKSKKSEPWNLLLFTIYPVMKMNYKT